MNWLHQKTLVVPVDFSPESFGAVDVAEEMAAGDATIHLLHVLPELNLAEAGVIWTEIDNDKRSRATIKALQEKLTEAQRTHCQIEVLFGDAGHQIADFAQKIGADLIVMPSHGRTGLDRLLIGSVAERVIRLAHCPVLVLRK